MSMEGIRRACRIARRGSQIIPSDLPYAACDETDAESDYGSEQDQHERVHLAFPLLRAARQLAGLPVTEVLPSRVPSQPESSLKTTTAALFAGGTFY
jgi:hypothetical protein